MIIWGQLEFLSTFEYAKAPNWKVGPFKIGNLTQGPTHKRESTFGPVFTENSEVRTIIHFR